MLGTCVSPLNIAFWEFPFQGASWAVELIHSLCHGALIFLLSTIYMSLKPEHKEKEYQSRDTVAKAELYVR